MDVTDHRWTQTDGLLTLDRGAMARPRGLRLDSPPMPKPEKHPTPPDHRVYPRGAAPGPPPKPQPEKRPTWTRTVPPDRAFPRS